MSDACGASDGQELAGLSWPEVRERAAASVLAVPIGSTEQHGPHLPLSTDTDVALALCAGLATARPAVLVAPAVPYGSSGEHAGFPGTISIGQEALELLLVELVRSATDTFERVLLVSAHGGNAAPVHRAVQTLRAEGRAVRSWAPTGYADAHAGRSETSLQLALRPAAVDRSRAEPGDVRPLAVIAARLGREGVRALSANGVLGDPRGASAAEGRQMLRRLVAELTAFADRAFAGDVGSFAAGPVACAARAGR